MKTWLPAAVAALAGLVAVVPVTAHHSFAAEYDANKPITLTGTVTKIEWTNPHCYFYVDVKNRETGKMDNWALELGNPNALLRNGWTPNSVKIGEEVTVEGYSRQGRYPPRQCPIDDPGEHGEAPVRRLEPDLTP